MYILQRGKVKGEWQVGQKVTEYFNPDYMGSAEYEFGAMPKSLRAMNTIKMKELKFLLQDKMIYVLCEAKDFDQIKSDIFQLAAGTKRLKERVGFSEWIYPDTRWHGEEPRDNIWWELEHHYVFSMVPGAIVGFGCALNASIRYMNEQKGAKT